MTASALYTPWFLPLFGLVWAGCMTYVGLFFFTVLRLRRLTGESTGADDWLAVWRDPTTVRYLRWFFSREHRALGDPLVSLLTWIIRILFVILLPTMLLMMFVIAPRGLR